LQLVGRFVGRRNLAYELIIAVGRDRQAAGQVERPVHVLDTGYHCVVFGKELRTIPADR
jgi:hypothetical protein